MSEQEKINKLESTVSDLQNSLRTLNKELVSLRNQNIVITQSNRLLRKAISDAMRSLKKGDDS